MRADQVYRDIFRTNLRVEMDLRGWTIRDLAADSGVSVSALVTYRSGRRDIPLAKVYQLALTLGCPVTNLILPGDAKLFKKLMRGGPVAIPDGVDPAMEDPQAYKL